MRSLAPFIFLSFLPVQTSIIEIFITFPPSFPFHSTLSPIVSRSPNPTVFPQSHIDATQSAASSLGWAVPLAGTIVLMMVALFVFTCLIHGMHQRFCEEKPYISYDSEIFLAQEASVILEKKCLTSVLTDLEDETDENDELWDYSSQKIKISVNNIDKNQKRGIYSTKTLENDLSKSGIVWNPEVELMYRAFKQQMSHGRKGDPAEMELVSLKRVVTPTNPSESSLFDVEKIPKLKATNFLEWSKDDVYDWLVLNNEKQIANVLRTRGITGKDLETFKPSCCGIDAVKESQYEYLLKVLIDLKAVTPGFEISETTPLTFDPGLYENSISKPQTLNDLSAANWESWSVKEVSTWLLLNNEPRIAEVCKNSDIEGKDLGIEFPKALSATEKDQFAELWADLCMGVLCLRTSAIKPKKNSSNTSLEVTSETTIESSPIGVYYSPQMKSLVFE